MGKTDKALNKTVSFRSVCFLAAQTPGTIQVCTIQVESTELTDAQAGPILRVTIDGLEVLVRASDLLETARVFK